jgi:hypothetical protein
MLTVTERTIINALIITASFIVIPFIISESLTVDYLPALCLAGALALVVAFFFLKEKLCVCPILGGFFGGTFNFLPIPIGCSHIAATLLILYYVTGYVLIRQRPIKLGSTIFLWPMAIVIAIVLYHVHTLTLGSLGATTEGARPAYFMYLFTLAYFCGINVSTPSVSFLSRIPLYAVVLTFVSSIPFLLSTYIPALAPYLYSVTDSVNVEAYVNTQGGTTDAGDTVYSKLAAFGPMGAALQLYLLAHYPIGTWFSPSRLWVLLLSFGSLILAVSCGYRSDLFSFLFLTVVGGWCYYSWRALLIPTAFGVALLVLITASSNNLINVPLKQLPLIAQRTMSFLPGDWDEDAIESGKGSNFFRQNIEDVYLSEYALKSPLFGNGFDIDKTEFETDDANINHGRGDKDYLQAKLFIDGKLFHTGWISVYDNVGIVGFIGFIALQLTVIFVAARFVFRPNADRRSSLFPLYVWIVCNLTTSVASFYSVFGSFSDAYSGAVVYAILLSHLSKLDKATEPPVGPGERRNPVEFSGLTGANYGNRYGK